MTHKNSKKHNINTSNVGFIPSTVYGVDQYEKDGSDRLDDTSIDLSAKNSEEEDTENTADKFKGNPSN